MNRGSYLHKPLVKFLHPPKKKWGGGKKKKKKYSNFSSILMVSDNTIQGTFRIHKKLINETQRVFSSSLFTKTILWPFDQRYFGLEFLNSARVTKIKLSLLG